MSASLRPVTEHRARCLALARPLPVEQVPLGRALGLVLAQDLTSPVSLPGFDNSAMDGFAVRYQDVHNADQTPVSLPVFADVPAGGHLAGPVPAGQAVRIMTGAPLPAGVDTVVQVEWTDGWTDPVVIHRTPTAGRNIRRVGEDVVAGDRLLPAGTRLTSRAIGLAAAVGFGQLPVHRAPRVLVLATGDELREPGSGPLQPGQLYESNGHQLEAALRTAGAVPLRPGIIRDDPAVLTATLAEHLPRVDLVVTSGGVSAGAFDTVKEVLAATGTVEFARVAMQPGMPQGCGTLREGDRDVPVITLPGNPVSTFVSFEVFVAPVLRVLAGLDPDVPVATGTAATGWASPARKVQYVRARLGGRPGAHTLEPVGTQRSHLIADLAQADVLAVVPPQVERVHPGDTLHYLTLEAGR